LPSLHSFPTRRSSDLRWYSVDEANALLPQLRPLLERVRDQQAALAEDRSVALIRARAAQNGGGAAAQKLTSRSKALEKDVRQLQDRKSTRLNSCHQII